MVKEWIRGMLLDWLPGFRCVPQQDVALPARGRLGRWGRAKPQLSGTSGGTAANGIAILSITLLTESWHLLYAAPCLLTLRNWTSVSCLWSLKEKGFTVILHIFWHAGRCSGVLLLLGVLRVALELWVHKSGHLPLFPSPVRGKKKSSLLSGMVSSYGLYMPIMGIIKIYSAQYQSVHFWPILDLV